MVRPALEPYEFADQTGDKQADQYLWSTRLRDLPRAICFHLLP